MDHAPRPEEILSVFSGLRPLVRKGHAKTSKLSRDHTILVSPSGLVTVTGGKWTTYRRMGQDTIDRASQVAALPKSPSKTLELKLHGWTPESDDCELRMGVRIRLRSAGGSGAFQRGSKSGRSAAPAPALSPPRGGVGRAL